MNILYRSMVIILTLNLLLAGGPSTSAQAADKTSSTAMPALETMVRAKITATDLNRQHNKENNTQRVELIILDGNYRNQRFVVDFYPTDIFYGITLREKDEVFVSLFLDQTGSVASVHITEIARDRYMIYLLFGFVALLILIGGVKGIRAVLSLSLTYVLLLKVLFPLILQGYDPVYLTVAICSLITVFTLILVGGFNKKTFSAIIGTLCGLATAACLAIVIGHLSHLTGAVDDEFYLLEYLPQGAFFSYQGLLFAGIIIGALGAVMDVSMSIASAINELYEKSYLVTSFQLIKAGMNVGKDIIGTMANTLILAYAGGSIYALLLLSAENIPLHHLVNREIIAGEILRSMAGSIGLIITVPITAIIAGLWSRPPACKK